MTTTKIPASSVNGFVSRGPLLAAGTLTALLGITATALGPVVSAAVAAVGLFVLCAYRPVTASYLYLLLLPFVAGMDRGSVIPLVRLNEALLVVLLAGACAGGYARHIRGAPLLLRLRPLDVPLATFVFMSTVWPITSVMLRGHDPQISDLAALLPICKLTALFLLVRLTVVTDTQLRLCARIIVWTGAVIGVVAVLQTFGAQPVLSVLRALWPAMEGLSQRGTTTLGSSAATGDYVIIGLTVVVCSSLRGVLSRRELLWTALPLGAGVFAAGQFATWVSAVVAGVVLLRRQPQLRRATSRVFLAIGVAMLIGAPALLGRLSDFFQAGHPLPVSWLGRWDNISTFYLPRLFDLGFILGVSPNSVLPAPETTRDVIYLESGYLQLLWVGGIPLLLAFAWLSVRVLREARRLGAQAGVAGVYAIALEVVWWVIVVLCVFDPHLFLRGSGDILFVLLAIVSGRIGDDRQPKSKESAVALGDAARD